jgi:UDP-N-acetylglucosamine acyltransferase
VVTDEQRNVPPPAVLGAASGVAAGRLYRARMSVHPTAVVSSGVALGTAVSIGPHAVVLGPCRIGDGVRIGPGCVVGSPPELMDATQNLAWDGELAHHGVEVGPGTVIREMCSIQQGSRVPTRIGAGCWLLARSYIAHDCFLGDGVTTSAGTAIGGHAHVGPGATLGMNVTVHQKRVVGPGAMVGMSSAVTRDVPPFAKVYGSPARLHGANIIGMARRGIGTANVDAVDAAYRSGRTPEELCAHPDLAEAWRWWSARVGAGSRRPGCADDARLSPP